MGCHCSKLSAVKIIRGNHKKTAECVAELNSAYEELRRFVIPELRPFNDTLPRLKIKDFLLHHHDLLLLSKEYLESTIATIELLSALKLVLSKARDRQSILLQALESYDVLKSYPQTLSKLNEFEEAGGPFAASLNEELASLCKRQRSVMNQLKSSKDRIRDKLNSTKKGKKVCKVMHNAAFVSALIVSVVLAAATAPPLATVAIAAGCTAIKTAEQWLDSIWANRLKALEWEKGLVLTMMKGELVAHELENVKVMVNGIDIRMGLISGISRFAVDREEEIAVKIAMEEDIKGKLGKVEECIGGVEMKLEACDAEIRKVVAQFLDVITSDM